MGAGHSNKVIAGDITIKYPTDKARAQATFWERKLLGYSGLRIGEQVFSEDIPIDYYGPNYIHTVYCRDGDYLSKPNVVIIHGFCGTGSNFYKMFPHLIQHFNVYCPDLIGMGFSSRPQIKFKTGIEYIRFFLEFLELWRIKMGLGRIYMMGHSLGGYFAGQYALFYPENIIHVSLLSPAGVLDISKGGKVTENMDPASKFNSKVAGLFWGLKFTIRSVYKNRLTKIALRRSMRNGFQIPKLECKAFAKVFYKVMRYPNDLNRCIYKIFKHPMPTAHLPLEAGFLALNPNYCVDFYYGQKDYMDQTGTKRLQAHDPDKYNIIIVSRFGHQFVLENPKETCDHLINRFHLKVICS